jgi:hypothetical protein
MKRITLLLILFISIRLYGQQVPQTVVVEHFTNTKCSVCASRNPGFYANLARQDNVLHIAIHPSSPYSACLLNKHNTLENDSRTQFYGVYGSTPKLVIQGNVLPGSADFTTQALFAPYLGKTSAFVVRTGISEAAGDLIKATVVVKAVAAHSLTNLTLVTSVVEDELNYAAPNGELMHHDVFRKSFFEVNGKAFAAPAFGDSLVFTATVSRNNAWTLAHLYALALVQDAATKQVLQASRSANLKTTTGVNESKGSGFSFYPNPAQCGVTVALPETLNTAVAIYDITGNEVLTAQIDETTTLPLHGLKNGIYFLRITNAKGKSTQKLIISK